jgi:hypothetical protein
MAGMRGRRPAEWSHPELARASWLNALRHGSERQHWSESPGLMADFYCDDTRSRNESEKGLETIANVVEEAGNGIREARHGGDKGECHDGEDEAVLDEILPGFVR